MVHGSAMIAEASTPVSVRVAPAACAAASTSGFQVSAVSSGSSMGRWEQRMAKRAAPWDWLYR